jgi:hypothetical protein
VVTTEITERSIRTSSTSAIALIYQSLTDVVALRTEIFGGLPLCPRAFRAWHGERVDIRKPALGWRRSGALSPVAPASKRSVYRRDPDPWIVGLRLPILAWFDSSLCWAPSLDDRAGSVRMSLVQGQLEWFERTVFKLRKFAKRIRTGEPITYGDLSSVQKADF